MGPGLDSRVFSLRDCFPMMNAGPSLPTFGGNVYVTALGVSYIPFRVVKRLEFGIVQVASWSMTVLKLGL